MAKEVYDAGDYFVFGDDVDGYRVARSANETKEYLDVCGHWVKAGVSYSFKSTNMNTAAMFAEGHQAKDSLIDSLRKQLKELGGELKKVKAENADDKPDVLPPATRTDVPQNGWKISDVANSQEWSICGRLDGRVVWIFFDGTVKEHGDYSKQWLFSTRAEAEAALTLYLRKQKGE